MFNLVQWATRHHVSLAAIAELRDMMGQGFESPQPAIDGGISEAAVTSRVLLEAPSKGVILWRNNVGVLPDANGTPVRFGLANISKEMNKKIKSHDYVGIRRKLIAPADVGHVIGQFVSREFKHAQWVFDAHDAHQAAQAKFGDIVNSYGGDAAFCTGVGSL